MSHQPRDQGGLTIAPLFRYFISMPRANLIFFYLLLSFNVGAQTQIFKLYDAADSSHIPFAHIVSPNYHTISNSRGEFVIPASSDTFNITCVGYQRLRIIPKKLKSNHIFLDQSLLQLDPVLITSRSPAEMIFVAVEKMQKRTASGMNTQKYTYVKGVFENDSLTSFRNADLWMENDSVRIDGNHESDNCSEYNLSSFSSDQLLPKQNHVFPALACLKRENAGLWNYEITERYLTEAGLELLITAEFYSPNNDVEHKFQIWLDSDKDQIKKIYFDYNWHIDFPSKILERPSMYSSLKRVSGSVLFYNDLPMFIDATYTLKVCDKFRKDICKTQVIFHEMRSHNLSGNQVLNEDFHSKIKSGIICPF